jgi:hypothetical protein
MVTGSVIEWRYVEAKPEPIHSLAAELVRLNADVIVTAGPTPTRAAKGAIVTIPIVMMQDPIRRVTRSSQASRALAETSQDSTISVLASATHNCRTEPRGRATQRRKREGSEADDD